MTVTKEEVEIRKLNYVEIVAGIIDNLQIVKKVMRQ